MGGQVGAAGFRFGGLGLGVAGAQRLLLAASGVYPLLPDGLFPRISSSPRQPGKTPAFRSIEPLAPAVTPTRFTDSKKVEKWFRRNCDDVLKRECTAQEKGDFISWIVTVK